jgi:prepilin-type N-terminal cleavage/methylation domain-containing protein
MLAKLRQMKKDEGFTLVELLVVIAILGILAGIVVFSVAGITDTGKTSACATEKSELTTAQEAYFASASVGMGNGKYSVDATGLFNAKLLQSVPTLYKTVSTTPFTTYSVSAIAGNPDGCL